MTLLFNYRGVEYHEGDFVALLGANSSPWIAQILSYESLPNDTVTEDTSSDNATSNNNNEMGIRVLWAWYPEEFKSELFPNLDTSYYSQYEVILSKKFSDLNPIDSIISKVTVLKYEEFMKLDEYPCKINDVYTVLFYRQLFDDKGLTPLLPLECNALFDIGNWKPVPRNPDLVYYRCKICDMKYQRPVEMVFKQKPSDQDIAITCSSCLSKVQGTAESGSSAGRAKMLKRRFSLESHKKRTIVDSDSDDSNSDDLAYTVEDLDGGDEYQVGSDSIKRIKQAKPAGFYKLNSFDKQMFSVAAEKMKECLNKGVGEMQSKNIKLNVNVMYLAEKIAKSLLDIYGKNPREFKQRLYEIYTNLKRDVNSDLRRRVICGQLSIHKLITIETRLLAPPDLIAEREKEREKHFARNVLIPINETINTSLENETSDAHSASTDENAEKIRSIDTREYNIHNVYNRSIERLKILSEEYQRPFKAALDTAFERVRGIMETSNSID